MRYFWWQVCDFIDSKIVSYWVNLQLNGKDGQAKAGGIFRRWGYKLGNFKSNSRVE